MPFQQKVAQRPAADRRDDGDDCDPEPIEALPSGRERSPTALGNGGCGCAFHDWVGTLGRRREGDDNPSVRR
jgi:hypothetical protein